MSLSHLFLWSLVCHYDNWQEWISKFLENTLIQVIWLILMRHRGKSETEVASQNI